MNNRITKAIAIIANQTHQMGQLLESDGAKMSLSQLQLGRLDQLQKTSYEFLAIVDKLGRRALTADSPEQEIFYLVQKDNSFLSEPDQEYYRQHAHQETSDSLDEQFGDENVKAVDDESTEPTAQIPYDTAVGQGADKVLENVGESSASDAFSAGNTYEETVQPENVAQQTLN